MDTPVRSQHFGSLPSTDFSLALEIFPPTWIARQSKPSLRWSLSESIGIQCSVVTSPFGTIFSFQPHRTCSFLWLTCYALFIDKHKIFDRLHGASNESEVKEGAIIHIHSLFVRSKPFKCLRLEAREDHRSQDRSCTYSSKASITLKISWIDGRTYPVMNSCLLSFLSPLMSNLAMISLARFFGSHSPFRSMIPIRSYYHQRTANNRAALFSTLPYHRRDQIRQFFAIDLSIFWVIPSKRKQEKAWDNLRTKRVEETRTNQIQSPVFAQYCRADFEWPRGLEIHWNQSIHHHLHRFDWIDPFKRGEQHDLSDQCGSSYGTLLASCGCSCW